jgi:polyphenol oxidase
MQKIKKNDIEWLEFDLLADIPLMRHGVFLRAGGSSQGCFSSLNSSYDVGDDPNCVSKNLVKIQEILEIPHLTWANQIHGSDIIRIDSLNKHIIPECDGLISNTSGIGLMVKHADCQAAIFYDPKNHAVANVHAGWRGSVQNIYRQTIHAMKKAFGSDPSNLLVCISPSLGPESAEFIYYENELPEEFWKFQTAPYFFDFWSISENQLMNEGILSHHIEIARIDTYLNAADYFSYRRDKITGRHATCVKIS